VDARCISKKGLLLAEVNEGEGNLKSSGNIEGDWVVG